MLAIGKERPIEDVISEHLTNENVKKAFLRYIEWLRANEMSPTYAYFEGQSPFWEVEHNGKKHFIVWDGKETVSVMIQAIFSDEYQAIIQECNLQNIILDNLQQCSRTGGEHCNNCQLAPDVLGVDKIIFGKEVKNLCCGEYITFENPNAEAFEAIKKLLEL